MDSLQTHFAQFRCNILGIDQKFDTPFGEQTIMYSDWTASGRLYTPIEEKMLYEFGPFVANTHTKTNITGSAMTLAYHTARQIIKKHVNAGENDKIIAFGSGMTSVVNKFQRILGLRVHEKYKDSLNIAENDRPVVFVTHMEHHSNHTSWQETIADVEVIAPDIDGLVDLNDFARLLERYKDRTIKIAAVSACSNVTGIRTPYHTIAKMTHNAGGLCFVDFGCSAPYVEIDMHPADPEEKLDAIFFSPHKFLGGPGTPGILIFDAAIYTNKIPDHPGGATVKWTNPWNIHPYIDNIEDREDGGTPPFLQTIKTALCIKLKEEMNPALMLEREEQMAKYTFARLKTIKGMHILGGNVEDRLCIFSYYVEGLHYNLAVKLLNDRFGIQARGGCSCAGTYAHYLLEMTPSRSSEILEKIMSGDNSERPGWVRFSLHPTMTDQEVKYICDAIEQVANNFSEWGKDYTYDKRLNFFTYNGASPSAEEMVSNWFDLHHQINYEMTEDLSA